MYIKLSYLLAGILTVATLQADEIFVNSSADSGAGTLRQALQNAQSADFIIFDQSLSGQTILLNSDLPSINKKISIIGPSGGNTILHGNNRFRLFAILAESVTISNLDLLNSDVSSPGGTLFVDSNATASLSDLSINSSNQCVFANQDAQVKAINISTPLVEGYEHEPSMFMISPGSVLTVRSNLASLTQITAAGMGNVSKVGNETIALNTTAPSVAFAIDVQEGTLVFTGNSTQPIIISPGAMLKGNNTSLYLANRGIVKTGQSIGTSSIVGDFIQVAGGTLQAEIAPSGASDLYLVGANANLAGNLFVIAQRGAYFKGNTFTFLTTGGVVNGVFDSVSTNSGGLVYKINYFPNSIQIEILQNLLSFDGEFVHGNAAKIYPILANTTIAPGTDLANVIIALNALDSHPTLENALNEIQPSSLGGLNWNEASNLHHINTILLEERGTFCGKNCLKNPIRPCCPSFKKNGLWISGVGERLHQNNLGGMRGFKATTYGGLVGYDRAVSETATLGVAGAYTHGNLFWNKDGGKTSTKGYAGALYTAFCLGRLQVDASTVGSYYRNDVKREINFSTIDRKAKSSPNGHAIMGHVGAGYLFVKNYFKITPFINGEYFHTNTSSLKEHGAQSLNLRVKKFTTNFIRGQAGVAIGEEFCTSWGIFSPSLSLSYVRFSPFSNTHIKAKFVDISQEFTVKTTDHAFNEIAPAASLGFSAGNNVWILASYEGEFAKKRQDQAISLNLRAQF